MNRSGPRQEPWGIPQVTILADDLCPSTVQNCFLFRRYEVNQSPVIPLMPYFSSFANKMVWSTVSNAFFQVEKDSKVHFFSVHGGVPGVSAVYQGCYCGIQFTKSSLVTVQI